jgi:hypothetical protein
MSSHTPPDCRAHIKAERADRILATLQMPRAACEPHDRLVTARLQAPVVRVMGRPREK